MLLSVGTVAGLRRAMVAPLSNGTLLVRSKNQMNQNVSDDNDFAQFVERKYNEAYDHWLHCSESEAKEAERTLIYWRRLWLSS